MASDSARLEIYFSFNKFNITTTEAAKIDSFLKAFETSKYILNSISVYGHTDQIGSNEYNDILSLKRANSVADFLKKEKKIIDLVGKLVGFGKHQLVSTSIDEKDRFYNRRVVITFFFEENKTPTVVEKIVKKQEPFAGKPDEVKSKTQKLGDKINDTTLKVGDNLELPYILFWGGMHEFLRISYPYLEELANVMKANPTLKIEIQGHICCQPGTGDGMDNGTSKKNLSVARAKAVYEFLKDAGISSSRMTYNGYGHQFPLTEERTEEEKTRNRRVEIKILKK